MADKNRAILDHLCLKPDSSQRDISNATGISLGQVNLLIKRLCDNGFLRQEEISSRKHKYVLTQRGQAEKARLSNENILLTIRNYRRIKDSVRDLLGRLHGKGYKEFVLEGERGEMHDIVSEVFDDELNDKATLLWGPAEGTDGRVILNLGRGYLSGTHTVNVLNEIR